MTAYDKQRGSEISDEICDLENRIVATQAMTRADLAAKRRFIRKIGFVTPGPDHHGQTGTLCNLVDMILQMDEERTAARRTRRNGAAVTEAPSATAG